MIWYQALFGLQGRLNRKGFWQGVGINFAFLFVFANFLANLAAYQPLIFAPLAVSFYSFFALGVKRLHDRDRSGKNASILLVPLFCLLFIRFTPTEKMEAFLIGVLIPVLVLTIVLIDWGVFRGYEEPNQYGEKGLSINLK